MTSYKDATVSIIHLDYANAFIPDIRVNAGDRQGRIINVQLLNNGVPVGSENISVNLVYNQQLGVLMGGKVAMSKQATDNGIVYSCKIPADACRMPGKVAMSFEIKEGDSVLYSRPFTAIVDHAVLDDFAPESNAYKLTLAEAAQQAHNAEEKALEASKQALEAAGNIDESKKSALEATQQALAAAENANHSAQSASSEALRASNASQKVESIIQEAEQAKTHLGALANAAENANTAASKANTAASNINEVIEKCKQETEKTRKAGFNAESAVQKANETESKYRNNAAEIDATITKAKEADKAAHEALETVHASAGILGEAKKIVDSVKEASEIAKRVTSAVEELKPVRDGASEATRVANAAADNANTAASKANASISEVNEVIGKCRAVSALTEGVLSKSSEFFTKAEESITAAHEAATQALTAAQEAKNSVNEDSKTLVCGFKISVEGENSKEADVHVPLFKGIPDWKTIIVYPESETSNLQAYAKAQPVFNFEFSGGVYTGKVTISAQKTVESLRLIAIALGDKKGGTQNESYINNHS
ncbi:BppU family phage baseplate upper protein [Gardnerella sp. Marseille-Q2328]|uniref:BppU family phage baseplate upper protein n=1 Tax=Gardnerella sp. Marseille-Q2328 TaxID=2759694 RepID=UPI0020258D76|nr:BppU family phage baseplate upper protein [Gardnerella sp. Marseille-Q2328]